MAIFDNVNNKLIDDLKKEIKPGAKLSIAAACFSIYAFQALKEELEQIDELRFIFTSPTFVSDQEHKELREFYIPRLNRERSLYGDEFEVRLKNELTQRAVARECAGWIRQKVKFRSNRSKEEVSGFILADDSLYEPIRDFTTVELGLERGNNLFKRVHKLGAEVARDYLDEFDRLWEDKRRLQDVTAEVVEKIEAAYKENPPEFIYFVALYNIFHEFIADINNSDALPNEALGFKESAIWKTLYNFQRDAALAVINKLERYNGCVLADSVGLGKTFTALAVMKYYQTRNKDVLVLCPKKLAQNWTTFKSNYVNNPIASDKLRYEVLFHTDLSRSSGLSNGVDLELLNWGAFDLIVIDESHNFRNGPAYIGGDERRDNRYGVLMNKIIRSGVKTKVLMLSATPVNNRFNDLRNQLALAYEGEAQNIDGKLGLSRSINDIFRNAQSVFNAWSKLDVSERTTEKLLGMLNFDFFEVLDAVTIARSRKHIERYYDTSDIGTFPERLAPISRSPELTDLKNALDYSEIFERLSNLSLAVYTPTHFIHESKKKKYADVLGDEKKTANLTQENRELGLRRIMAINLMKRMESSVHSFGLTLRRVLETCKTYIDIVQQFKTTGHATVVGKDMALETSDWDDDDLESSEFVIGRKVKIELEDMDYLRWLQYLEYDRKILQTLLDAIKPIDAIHDSKLRELLDIIAHKIENPINPGNKKLLVFTAFADTADYLYKHVSEYVKKNYGLDAAVVSGTDCRTTLPKFKADVNNVLTAFSPISKNRAAVASIADRDIDVLIATDCISEGQNLQDCDYLVNYDIHWNPVRIIQRFGRVDRIGSKNSCVQLVNFWPNVSLDEYIDLRNKVETRMKIVDLAATGDDNVISPENIELEYRKAQLQRLQKEVVDLEEMNNGVSILDLGLNDFRMDLVEYFKSNPGVENAPLGMHAVARANDAAPPGVVYVLRNRTDSVNIDRKNRLHPFYLVYVDNEGGVVCDCFSPKEILDKTRLLCKGKTEPIAELYRAFNKETNDGRKMNKYSELLGEAIKSIVQKKDESFARSVFRPGVTAPPSEIKGLDDFELVCFLVVR
ncbi:MAG: DEAD/DEAH box helicase family protein [Thermoguttaceae bacterium]|nr:DEAD/DEAH box helicase family protein [Thermoguttaceae bacterium]